MYSFVIMHPTQPVPSYTRVRSSASSGVYKVRVLRLRLERRYLVRREGDELVIRNAAGEEMRGNAASSGQHPYVRALFQDAAMALAGEAETTPSLSVFARAHVEPQTREWASLGQH